MNKRRVCEIFFTVKNQEQAVDTIDLAQYIVLKGWVWYRDVRKNTKVKCPAEKDSGVCEGAKNRALGGEGAGGAAGFISEAVSGESG